MSELEDKIRLNKYLALQQGVSRREADNLIAEGRVRINDEQATLGARFLPTDTIFVDGKPLNGAVEFQYYLIHKPVNYVCSRKKQGDNDTIYSIVPKDLHHLNPVGRLDKDSSGLLLLTNDGDFAYQMTHPKFYKTKRYEIKLDRDLEPLHHQMINDFGVALEDGPSKLTLTSLHEGNKKDWEVVMSEGRNRQIRRTFAALGYTVIGLHRTHFGNYSLGDISPADVKKINIPQKA